MAVCPDIEKPQDLSGSDMAHWLGLSATEKRTESMSRPFPEIEVTQEMRQEAQLDSAQREINEVRRQVMMAEMQACGYLPVYQEDGSVEFVLASQLKEPVEM